MLKREHLKRKLEKYAKIKEQKYPKCPSRDEVIAALENVERLIKAPYSYIKTEDLDIICAYARTVLNTEPPEGMEWKLVEKKSCNNCARKYGYDCIKCNNLERWAQGN